MHPPETFTLSKPAVKSAGGIVAAQHWEGAEAGAAVLRAGGNAVDAAVATALAIGCVEPWMSGIGGGGFMLVASASEKKVHQVSFGMVAPKGLDVGRYALAEGGDAIEDFTFVWPKVVDDRNLLGPESVGVPGAVAGLSAALDRFGSLSWKEAMQPALRLADAGLPLDWYQTLQIAYGAAAGLGRFSESARVYLPGGIPPISLSSHRPDRVRLGALRETLRRLADAGPQDFYEGQIADGILKDMAASAFSADDLSSYEAEITEAPGAAYRDARVHLASGLTGGPTFLRALRTIEGSVDAAAPLGPKTYVAWAEALSEAYEDRLAELGHASPADELACTTHISVVDREGNMVALTNTLLERFGSRYMGAETGILFNNGLMWFDPEQGRPNSIAPGKRPLSNMCPTIVTDKDGAPLMACGASGGRRIVPACFQATAMAIDYGMDLDAIQATPRIDVSGPGAVSADARLDAEVVSALSDALPTERTYQSVGVRPFANPQIVMRRNGMNSGVAVPEMATSAAVAE